MTKEKTKIRKRPTLRQEALAEGIIRNSTLAPSKRKNKMKLVAEVGYSKGIQKTPSKAIDSEGVQNAIEDILNKAGLTKELVAEALAEDINIKKQNRVQELKLASDILGMVDNKTNINVGLFSLSEALDQARQGNGEIIEQTPE